MEGVNHVDIVQVGSGSLVCDIDRMLQWQAPYREGLKLGIAGTDATLVLIVELAQAYGHFPRTWAWSRDNNQLA